jgi:hypothetical protein
LVVPIANRFTAARLRNARFVRSTKRDDACGTRGVERATRAAAADRATRED